jgi:hypothetical protein
MARIKFDLLPKSYENVFENDSYLIYRKTIREPVLTTWYPENPFLLGSSGLEGNCDTQIWDGAVTVRKVEIQPERALPGDEVTLRLVYEKTNIVGYSLPLVLYVRFDHHSITTSTSRYPGEKYIRRFKQRSSDSRSRFRVDHPVFGGLYAPDIWPIGGLVVEELQVRLPTDLEPGVYSVQLKLAEQSLIPNHHIGDFLYNRDSYTGPVCGSLEVTTFVAE